MRTLILVTLILLTWTGLAVADRHASCSECGQMYVLSKKGVGFARHHVGKCPNCRITIEIDPTKIPKPSMWTLLTSFTDALRGTDNRFGDHDGDGVFNVHDADYEGILWSAGPITVSRSGS